MYSDNLYNLTIIQVCIGDYIILCIPVIELYLHLV